MITRRTFLATAAAVPAASLLSDLVLAAQGTPVKSAPLGPPPTSQQVAARQGFFVSMHEASSERFDFPTAMQGYAKAGVRAVEPNLVKVREFTQKPGESPASAKRVLDDAGLKPVSSSNQLGLPEPGQNRQRSLDDLKWKVELAHAIGADRIVCPSAGPGMYKRDDFMTASDNMREAGEIAKQAGVTCMLEFARTSHLAGSLPTALMIVRNANHPNVRVMMDTYHFWGGISKFEDLDLLHDGELYHLHFEDVPSDPPREIQGQPDRVLPGEGIAPLKRILETLKKKKYSGPLSFESFKPEHVAMDPFELATRVRGAVEPIIKSVS
ncbi:MAG TPA: sugar phosphate isomerase/epimerase family protein [Vicinamibacterales bacterium]|nr:sugar phosphate isomerase/epimerase family protein [Vicinamibacterales bacterium]